MKDHIAILDFGSQYTHLIARNIRESNVKARIYPHDTESGRLSEAWGIIISGGPQSVYGKDSITIDKKILDLGIPILGLCYGHQLVSHLLGGEVKSGKVKEYGKAKMKIVKKSALFSNVGKETQVWMSHGDSVTKTPPGFSIIGSTGDCPAAAVANEEKNIFTLQFHPEVDHTKKGGLMIKNFVFKICRAEKNWKIENVVKHLTAKIRKQATDKKVFVLVSGGVDSNVAFSLLTKALGEKRVMGLYIDTGFMRKDESAEILENFKKAGFHNLRIVDASETFFDRLKNVYEPEEKRQIIGNAFLDIKEKASRELKLDPRHWLLGQGTIYPDTIESGGTKNSDKIKTHHNRVDAVSKLIEKGLVIEPLVDFYKYEVRKIGKILGLPQSLIDRHPFPGPGLAIRCLCAKAGGKNGSAVKADPGKILRNRKHIGWRVLPIKSVGVQGDNRTYAHPLAIWGENDWKKLDDISVSITNNFPGINRVILLLNPAEKNSFQKPDQDFFLSRERVETLREIDSIVSRHLERSGLYGKIWQFPVVLVPITDGSGKESVVLRPVNTRDAMTLDFYRIPKAILKKITRDILKTGKVFYVFYDITNKPPGTTEWE